MLKLEGIQVFVSTWPSVWFNCDK